MTTCIFQGSSTNRNTPCRCDRCCHNRVQQQFCATGDKVRQIRETNHCTVDNRSVLPRIEFIRDNQETRETTRSWKISQRNTRRVSQQMYLSVTSKYCRILDPYQLSPMCDCQNTLLLLFALWGDTAMKCAFVCIL